MVGDGHLHRSVVREGHHAEGVGRTAGGLEGADRLLLLRGICAQAAREVDHGDHGALLRKRGNPYSGQREDQQRDQQRPQQQR